MSDTDEKSVAERWQERLTEARVPIGDGLEPELLADRYDVESAAEIEELTTQATKEMIRGDHTLLVLDDLDAAEEKLEDAGDYEVATDGGTSHVPEKDLSVPLEDAVGYLHIGVDPDCDPVPGEGYWIPVGEQQYAEQRHPPRGHVIQYPKDDREPSRVGDRDVPDHVRNWDYRGETE